MKYAILILAAEMGYFRAKKEDKKSAIASEVAETLGFNLKDVADMLDDETHKRAAAYRKRESARLAKADKPLTSNNAAEIIPIIEGDKFLISTAQNNTKVNETMLSALLHYAKENDARLIIGETLYNKNSYLQPDEVGEEVYFDHEVRPYMIGQKVYLGNESLMFYGCAHVSPTAKDALAGFQAATGGDLVIPATQVALQVLPALKGSRPRRMYATGSVTLKNTVNRKAGQTAHFSTAALFCEKQANGTFNCRHLELMPDAEGFNDIDGRLYRADGITNGGRPAGLQLGDVHAEHLTPEVWKECLDFISRLNPERIQLNDVLDFRSRNHHNKHDMPFLYSQELQDASIVQDINGVVEVINSILDLGEDYIVDIVASNHDAALQRWLEEKMAGIDRYIDPTNAEFQYAGCLAYIQALRRQEVFNPIAWACGIVAEDYKIFDNRGNLLDIISSVSRVNFHLEDASVIIGGVEHVHGHRGAGGARGSGAKGFAKLGILINSGHTHSPAIYHHSYVAGVCSRSLDMGYNVGQSAWAWAHIVTYQNGQRQVIFMN